MSEFSKKKIKVLEFFTLRQSYTLSNSISLTLYTPL